MNQREEVAEWLCNFVHAGNAWDSELLFDSVREGFRQKADELLSLLSTEQPIPIQGLRELVKQWRQQLKDREDESHGLYDSGYDAGISSVLYDLESVLNSAEHSSPPTEQELKWGEERCPECKAKNTTYYLAASLLACWRCEKIFDLMVAEHSSVGKEGEI